MKSNLKSSNTRSKTFKTASIVFFILGLIYLWVRYFAKSIINTDKVCHENKCFIVEIADTDQERELGLMNRKSMASNKWMLFIFENQKQYIFWMKNTLIPLDMLRVDSKFNVVDIQTAQPCTWDPCKNYIPKWNATYVLELNAWAANENNIKIWDKLKFKLN